MKMQENHNEKYHIRALVSQYILEVIEKDTKHFRIPKYSLCNLILIKFSLDFNSDAFQDMTFDKKAYLQFSLHKENIPYYTNLKRGEYGINESELIRKIFSSYAILPPFLRETHLFREKISFLQQVNKKKKVLKFHTLDGVVEAKIDAIQRNFNTGFLEIIVNNTAYYISQIEIIN